MKKVDKEPWHGRFCEAYKLAFTAIGFGSLVTIGICVGVIIFKTNIEPHFASVPAVSPGELVDKAMAIPGAIVISPHRDLRTMGILDDNSLITNTGGPAIAVHTPKRWCVWSVGSYATDDRALGDKLGRVVTYISDNAIIVGTIGLGFEGTYKEFTKCVDDGFTFNPMTDFGAACDGKSNDEAAIKKTVDAARRSGVKVMMPSGCMFKFSNGGVIARDGTVPDLAEW